MTAITPSNADGKGSGSAPSSYAGAINLPAIPPELKPLQPYIQRATELRTKDPVMCYWCLYYAAKQGIAIKLRGKESRPFLFALMELLENLKKDLGNNDAVASDAAGSEYIQKFGLRVFNMADNEDRSGGSTRSTAKKFLAAANFLEILQVFDIPEAASNDEKVRYAKWKAADIAKAFREGRSPQPGPAHNPAFPLNWTESTPSPPSLPPAELQSTSRVPSETLSGTVSPSNQASSSTFSSIHASPIPPTHLPLPLSPSPQSEQLPPSESYYSEPDPVTPIPSPQHASRPLPLREYSANLGVPSPESWSTVATPGLDGPSNGNGSSWDLSSSPTPFPKFDSSDREGTIRPRGLKRRNGARFIEKKGEHSNSNLADEDDGSGTDVDGDGDEGFHEDVGGDRLLRPDLLRGRQDSWSSLMVDVGDGFMSRQGSVILTPVNEQDDSELKGGHVLSGIPEKDEERLSSSSLSPVPTLPRIALLKKVHFSPSVTGGLTASNASTSPPRDDIELPVEHEKEASTSSVSTSTSTTSATTTTSSNSTSSFVSLPPLPPSTGSSEEEEDNTPVPDPFKTPTSSFSPYDPPRSVTSTHSRESSVSLAPAGSTPYPTPPTLPSRQSQPVNSPQTLSSSIPLPPSPAAPPLVPLPSSTHSSPGVSSSPQLPPSVTITRSPKISSSAPLPPYSPSSSPTKPSSPRLPSLHQRSVSQPSSTPTAPIFPAFPAFLQTVPPPPPPPPSNLPTSLTPTQIADIQRHAKFAISALNFEDLPTARKELMLAMAILDGKLPGTGPGSKVLNGNF